MVTFSVVNVGWPVMLMVTWCGEDDSGGDDDGDGDPPGDGEGRVEPDWKSWRSSSKLTRPSRSVSSLSNSWSSI